MLVDDPRAVAEGADDDVGVVALDPALDVIGVGVGHQQHRVSGGHRGEVLDDGLDGVVGGDQHQAALAAVAGGRFVDEVGEVGVRQDAFGRQERGGGTESAQVLGQRHTAAHVSSKNRGHGTRIPAKLGLPNLRVLDEGAVETRGIEPLTPALQRRCSAN